jgi:hypothetical protein
MENELLRNSSLGVAQLLDELGTSGADHAPIIKELCRRRDWHYEQRLSRYILKALEAVTYDCWET